MRSDMREYELWLESEQRMLRPISWSRTKEAVPWIEATQDGNIVSAHKAWLESFVAELAPAVEKARRRIERVQAMLDSVSPP
jgi:hypothetical protein